MRIVFLIACMSVLTVIWWPRDTEPVDYAPLGDYKTPAQYVTSCPKIGQLSVKKQIERINEILGTPNEPPIGLK